MGASGWLSTGATSGDDRDRHRVTVAAALFLFVLGTFPIFVHRLPQIGTVLAGVDHLGALCVAALHALFTPVHVIFYVALATGIVYAAADRCRVAVRSWRMLDSLDAHPPEMNDPLWRAAVVAGLDPGRLRVATWLPSPAFTVGWITPRVYVAAAVSRVLSRDELTAVLAHERAHVMRRDPLRLSAWRALANTLFWMPAVRGLTEDLADAAEIAADDAAAGDQPAVLAQALVTLANWSPLEQGAGVGMTTAAPDLLERRVRRLVGERPATRTHVTRRSLVGALAALTLAWSSGVVVAHPLPALAAVEHERHCDHGHESPLAHLFCLTAPAKSSECPHRHAALAADDAGGRVGGW